MYLCILVRKNSGRQTHTGGMRSVLYRHRGRTPMVELKLGEATSCYSHRNRSAHCQRGGYEPVFYRHSNQGHENMMALKLQIAADDYQAIRGY